MVKKMEHGCCPSKPHLAIMGIVAIALGIWAWITSPTLVQLVAILLILVGLKKLSWAIKAK